MELVNKLCVSSNTGEEIIEEYICKRIVVIKIDVFSSAPSRLATPYDRYLP